MAKHFKGEFLVSKIVATIIILGYGADAIWCDF